jgi:hypothetical protein
MTNAEWCMRAAGLRCDQHEHGPPDIETFDRRRVDPPAGCRAAAEPASLAGRWSAEMLQLKNN